MISQLTKEQQYRLLDIDSYSSIKTFLDDRKKYHKKFILKEEIEEEESKSLLMGGIVDTLKFEPEEFDNRYVLAVVQEPTGQMFKFVKALFKRTVECMAEDGSVSRDFTVLMKESYNDVKFDRNGNIVDFKRDKFETVVEKFVGSDAELYYKQLRVSYGKKVIELSDMQNGEKVAKELDTNWVTREVFGRQEGKRWSIYTQHPIIFEMNGYQLKALIDKLDIDHEEKKIYLYDLKTCWDNEREFQTNYFKYKYYLQAAVYYMAVLKWAEKEGWKDYTIVPMQFIVADSTNYQNPLLYQTDVVNLQQGLEGFVIKGKYYPGVIKAIEDLKWHRDNDIWNISKDNYEAGGITKIKPFIEDEY